ncbi:MAG TPA: hypothetical protein VGJ20_07220 [Xanthobacteraceae bacterium]|jgi:hypothetical protein
MRVDRRSFISLLAVALGCSASALAEQGQGLFWRVETHGRSAVLFGYLRLPASRAPFIVADGIRMIEQTQSVIRDYENFACPTTHIAPNILPPLLSRLSPAVADEVRRALGASRIPQPELERTPGYAVVMSLLGEGTEGEGDPTIPSVGGLIFDRATALRRPLTTLLTDDEVRKLICPTSDDVIAVNYRIDEKEITSILNFRRQVGPIDAYISRLYVGRKTDELALYFKFIADHQISFHPHESRDPRIELLFTRLSAHLPSVPNPFAGITARE